jgi:hypothetical protein
MHGITETIIMIDDEAVYWQVLNHPPFTSNSV